MADKYILDGHKLKAVPLMEWAKWFESAGELRRVDATDVGPAHISTVFLGINHQYGDGPPLLFETMIFGGKHDGWQERCSTWEEAEQMHTRAVAIADKALE